MQHSQKYQHFALDANNNIIDIHSADKVCGKRYFCPHCHNEMIAKRGNVRQWHFAHKTEKCSYDKYLHSIAEKMIMDWFNQKESIVLEMEAHQKCSQYGACIFRMNEICTGRTTVQYNLKNIIQDVPKNEDIMVSLPICFVNVKIGQLLPYL